MAFESVAEPYQDRLFFGHLHDTSKSILIMQLQNINDNGFVQTDNKSRRNMNIAHAILKGESAAIVGKRYGLSAVSCMSILRAYCWRLDPLLYKSLQIDYQCVPLQVLREYSDAFFNIEKADYTITMDSPIWKVKELNNTIVKAFLCSNINTMRDLSVVEESDLKKIPMIGPKSLEKIMYVLQIPGE